MPSVVIAAHNEEQVIGPTLDALLLQSSPEAVEIVVSANGCSDETARVASRPGVIVLDRPEPGKAGALNAGDSVASSFPRIYLDADIVVPPGGISQIVEHFNTDHPPLAIVPARTLNTKGRPWPVRGYFTINEKLPAFREGLFGRGLIALSAEGRAKFKAFPLLIADDLFLDSLFSAEEKVEIQTVQVVVDAPHTSRDLLRRLIRVRRGNSQMRRASDRGEISVPIRRTDRWAWLREVVAHDPRLAPQVIPYLTFTLLAELFARKPVQNELEWGRDESTRQSSSRTKMRHP